VRHREHTGSGLPLQVYGYVKINQFVTFENIQSEVFEHLFAIMNEFELRIFQQPTGEDLLTLSGKN
jgi:miniconductance mechanosensitive channel